MTDHPKVWTSEPAERKRVWWPTAAIVATVLVFAMLLHYAQQRANTLCAELASATENAAKKNEMLTGKIAALTARLQESETQAAQLRQELQTALNESREAFEALRKAQAVAAQKPPQAPPQALDAANEKPSFAIPADIEKLMVKARTVGAAVQDPSGFWQRNRELLRAARTLSQRDKRYVLEFAQEVSRGEIDMFTPSTWAWARKLRDDGNTDTPQVKLFEKFFPFLIAETDSEFGLDVIAQRRVKALALAILNGGAHKLTIQELLALPLGEQRYVLTFHPYMVEYPAEDADVGKRNNAGK